MIDALNLAGSANSELIHLDEPRERAYWAHVLSISEGELRQIVDMVGPNAIDVRRHLAHARHGEWQRTARQSQPRIAATAGASADNRVFGMLAFAAAVVAATFGALIYSLMPADEWTVFQREHGCDVAANTDPTIAQLRCPDGRTIVRTNKVAGGAEGTSRKPLR
jgi:hypothetical protein